MAFCNFPAGSFVLRAILDGTADTEAAGRLQLLAVEVGEMILPRHPHRVVAKRLSRCV